MVLDKATVTLLLDQNLKTMKEFVELCLGSMRTEIKSLRDENNELKRSLEFSQSELLELQKKTSDNESQISTVKVNVTSFGVISERLRLLEDSTRKSNIKVDGLQESPNETWEQTQKKVESLIKEKLNVDVSLESALRIGKTDVRQDNDRPVRPRPIIARFVRYQQKREVMMRVSKLKGTNVYFNDDVCAATLEKRKPKIEELREMRKQGFIAYFSDCDIRVKTRRREVSGPVSEQAAAASDDARWMRSSSRVSDVSVAGGSG